MDYNQEMLLPLLHKLKCKNYATHSPNAVYVSNSSNAAAFDRSLLEYQKQKLYCMILEWNRVFPSIKIRTVHHCPYGSIILGNHGNSHNLGARNVTPLKHFELKKFTSFEMIFAIITIDFNFAFYKVKVELRRKVIAEVLVPYTGVG